MKSILKNSLLCVTLLAAAGAFAANKGPLQITDATSVGGKQLKPGDYTVSWNGDGPDVQLNVMKGSKLLTTVPAHVVAMDHMPGSNLLSPRRTAMVTRTPK